MFEERDPQGDKQNEFWLVRDQLPQATAGTFYRKLNELDGYHPSFLLRGLTRLDVDFTADASQKVAV